MQSWKKFPRFMLFITLLTSLLAGLSAPEIESVSAAPMRQPLLGCPASTIAQWTFAGAVAPTIPTPSTGPVSNVLLAGSGIAGPTYPAGELVAENPAVSFTNWNTSALDNNDYIELKVDTTGRSSINLDFKYYRSNTGPTSIQIRYSIDGTNFIDFGPAIATPAIIWQLQNIDFSSIPALDNNPNAAFRIYGYAGSAAGGTLRFDNITISDICIPPTPSPPIGVTDLSVINSVNNPAPMCGTNVVFTIEVINDGPDAATNVQIKDILPAGLTYVSNDRGAVYSSGTVTWNIATLPSGASASQKINITAKIITNVTVTNWAEVSASDQPDIDSLPTNLPTDEDDSDDAVVIPDPNCQADLSLSQTWNRSTTTADRVELKITVTNQELVNTATNVQVKNLLPSGLTYVSHTSGMTYSSSTGIWAVGTLTSGASSTLTIIATVSSSGTSTTNFAEVWLSDQFDPDSTPGNGDITEDDDTSDSSVPGPEILVADLRISETVDIAGSNAVFTITVNNAGPDDATNVTVKNSKLATDYTYVSSGSTAGTSYNTATGDWTIPTLLDGASATLTVTTTTILGALPVNWAQVSAVNEVDPDSLPGNCSSSVSSCTEDDDAGAPSADLFLAQSVNNANPDVGSNIVFTITVSNAGVAPTNNVQVKDVLPTGLKYVSDDSSGTYNKSTGIWTVGLLANSGVGASKTLRITATVTANGIPTNWAEVWKSDESDPDSVPGNSSTTEDDDAGSTITSHRSIIVNEVAWGGTAASPNDEWIELYNPSNAPILITGWILKSTSGSLNITLSGTIKSGEYFLLEREDNLTVSDVNADQVYPGASLNLLSDNGEVLTLRDGLGNFIDTANNENGGTWPKGGLSPHYGTMERQGTTIELDKSWVTNLGNPKNGKDANSGLIYGTPRKVNSTGSASTNVPVPTPTVQLIQPVGRPVINEVLPRPGFDWNQDGSVDVFDEFIEIKNLGPVDINMKGWKLDDDQNKGSAPFTIPDVILKPGQHLVFYGLQTNILLSDGGDTVRLLNPSSVVYDAYTYSVARAEDVSICRLPDTNLFGEWFEDCVPTPNLTNTRDGVVPSMPEEGFQSPVCDLPDTLPADFLIAECRGYGAKIWNSFYWDKNGWRGDQYVPENMSKWESFVE